MTTHPGSSLPKPPDHFGGQSGSAMFRIGFRCAVGACATTATWQTLGESKRTIRGLRLCCKRCALADWQMDAPAVMAFFSVPIRIFGCGNRKEHVSHSGAASLGYRDCRALPRDFRDLHCRTHSSGS